MLTFVLDRMKLQLIKSRFYMAGLWRSSLIGSLERGDEPRSDGWIGRIERATSFDN
jgi:hypothetical protein